MMCFLFPDNWLLSEEVQHWVIWAAEQNCTNSGTFTCYTGPLCGLLPKWTVIVELPLFRRGNCKLSRHNSQFLWALLSLYPLLVLSYQSSTSNSLAILISLTYIRVAGPFKSTYSDMVTWNGTAKTVSFFLFLYGFVHISWLPNVTSSWLQAKNEVCSCCHTQ